MLAVVYAGDARLCPMLHCPSRQGARNPQSVAGGSSAGGFDLTHGSSFMSKGSGGSATPYSLGSLTDTPAAQAYAGQLSFNQKPFNQMYKVTTCPDEPGRETAFRCLAHELGRAPQASHVSRVFRGWTVQQTLKSIS